MIQEVLRKRIQEGKEIAKGLSSDHDGRPFFSRPIFIRIKEYFHNFQNGYGGDRRWVIMLGLRGVGKSTILAQTYIHLINSGVESKNILYFSVDQMEVSGYSLSQYIDAYEQFLGQSFETIKEQTYFLIDETQTDKSWGKILKTLYDRNRNFFIFTTGSSALELQASPDIARRSTFEKLYPLSFTEFRMIKYDELPRKGLKAKLENALYFSDNASQCFSLLKSLETEVDNYWLKVEENERESYLSTGMFPFAIQHKNPDPAYSQLDAVIDKVISTGIKNKLEQGIMIFVSNYRGI